MAASKKKEKKPELKVVFDTNVLYTKAESYLFRKEVAELIKSNNKHTDIEISWYMPDIVRHERQYQMLKRSLELLPSIQKLEKLLGHNLNITADIISTRVKEAVEKQLIEYKLHTIKMDESKVDWHQMMHNSAYRLAPFDPGENEKGFRDALAAEAFLQLVKSSPITPKSCRLVLVTDDQLLRQTILSRLDGNVKNVRILPSIEELKGLINTLVSEADEEFINSIQEKSEKYFFQKGNDESLYYKEDVGKKIRDQYETQLKELPEGTDYRENGTWYIGDPQFVKKDGQRIHWATRIRVVMKLYNFVSEANSDVTDETKRRRTLADFAVKPTTGRVSLGALGMRPKFDKVQTAEGSTVFEVEWSVSVSTTTKSISKPVIDNVTYIETIWDNNNT